MGGDSFLTLMNQTLEEAMIGEGFSQVFINDVVAPITRVNYGQSVRVNGFVGKLHSSEAYFRRTFVVFFRNLFCKIKWILLL